MKKLENGTTQFGYLTSTKGPNSSLSLKYKNTAGYNKKHWRGLEIQPLDELTIAFKRTKQHEVEGESCMSLILIQISLLN